jgi:hypothetical protein
VRRPKGNRHRADAANPESLHCEAQVSALLGGFLLSDDGCRLLPRRHNDQQRRPDRRAPPRGHRQARLPDTITR